MLTSVGRCWLLTLRDIHQAGSHDEITARCLRNSTLIPQKECGAASKVSSTTLMMFARPRESLDFYFSFFRDRVVYTLTSRVLSIEIPHIFLSFFLYSASHLLHANVYRLFNSFLLLFLLALGLAGAQEPEPLGTQNKPRDPGEKRR